MIDMSEAFENADPDNRDNRIAAANQRIQTICTKLDTYNRTAPNGLGIQLNIPQMEIAATLDLVIRLMVETGLVTEPEFVARKTEAMAMAFEQAWGQSGEARRQAVRAAIVAR